MSLLHVLFTLPFGLALEAYQQARFELNLECRRFFDISSKRVRKADPEYAEALRNLPGYHIKAAIQPFLDRSGIREDLIFVETLNLGFCQAAGTNMFRKGDAAVAVAPGFYRADEDACRWLIKHEISHIKYNDTFTTAAVPGVCQLAASIFGMYSLSFLSALALAITVHIVSKALFSQWREAKADDFAIENSSDEELKGGRRFFIAVQETNIEDRTTFWKRVAISASGNVRLDILHPTITSRIQKIETALRARNVDTDIETERQKLDGGLKTFIAKNKRETEQALEQAGGLFGILKQQTHSF